MNTHATYSYFDYAATSPMRQVAIDTWMEHAGCLNPSSQYAAGRQARRVLDDAREKVAEIMGADPVEVIFTASGTEANNLAVQGVFSQSSLIRIVTTQIEHPAVGETIAKLGAEVEELPVDATGHVSDLSALSSPAALVTCMYANNETGAIQPIADIVAAAGDTPVHVDAVQAVGKIPVNFRELGVTTLASSAHKFGGPRGCGFLLARRSPAPQPVFYGGGQERGIRPGTVDVASAAATAAALEEAVAELEAEDRRVRVLRDDLRERIVASIDDVVVNTQEPALSGHLHLSFPGADGDSLLMLLDQVGVSASTGSACHSGVSRMSHVLEAMGVDSYEGLGSLRLTLGRTTTAGDVDRVLRELPRVVELARGAGLR